jgi:AGZA family xanthine/uracil permease-like MFS transporter
MASRWFVRGDIDGFFGLFVDNLLQLMLMVVLSGAVCGLPSSLILGRMLPGAAVSILFGNLFYAWQARKTGRADATALPFGINTPSLLAYIFLIMGPVYQETKDPVLAWRVGLFACLASGVFEVCGAFVGDWLRRHTPRAALLSALAGIAITFISMGFIFQIFARPWIALFPMLLLIATYASHVRLPFGIPGGLAAVIVGTAIAWIARAVDASLFQPSSDPVAFAFHPPLPVVEDALALVADARAYKYMAVIVPMGLFNVIGSLQNLESAEAAGDRYETRPSLLANGIGTIAAAFFGSAFPTTIYIGHPAWKAMGARSGYSVLNGAVVTLLCFFGAIPLVLKVIPVEATLGILLWIGIIISAQAFQEVPRAHAIGVGARPDRNRTSRRGLESLRGGSQVRRPALHSWGHRAQPRVSPDVDGAFGDARLHFGETISARSHLGHDSGCSFDGGAHPRLRPDSRRSREPLRPRRGARFRSDVRAGGTLLGVAPPGRAPRTHLRSGRGRRGERTIPSCSLRRRPDSGVLRMGSWRRLGPVRGLARGFVLDEPPVYGRWLPIRSAVRVLRHVSLQR